MLKHKLWILLVLVFSYTSSAQNNCPIIVQTALQNLERVCAGTGRNQACYANNAIVSEGRTAGYDFDTIGQIVNVMDMQTLVTSPLDVENNLWGVTRSPHSTMKGWLNLHHQNPLSMTLTMSMN
jgi:hypothetical protein